MEEGSRRHSRHKKQHHAEPVQENINYTNSEMICEGQANLTDEDDGVVEAPRKSHKKPCKKRADVETSFITAVLQELCEDVQENSPRQPTCGDVLVPCPTTCNNNPDKVFVQCKNGFTPTSRAKIFQSAPDVRPFSDYRQGGTPLELAIMVQQGSRTFYTFCHGLLAGLALIVGLLVSNIGVGPGSLDQFMNYYSNIARVVQSLFFMLTVICVVSIFDRCDLAHVDVFHISDALRYRAGDIIALLLYPCTLIITLLATTGDDIVSLHIYSRSHSVDIQDLGMAMKEWCVLNLFRCLGAFFGWVCVAFCPMEDMLYLHLSNMIKYQRPLDNKPSCN